MKDKREFDVILYGATGYTGRLVAEYLAVASSSKDLRWAVAGRNRIRLEQISERLGGVDVIVGDALDSEAMRNLASRARVVCTAVGPYTRYGSELVAACVRARTHYCDLAGELPWMREMIDTHHERARAAGTRIVHCCGFDSIPSDMGVLMMHEAMREHGARLGRVDALFGESKAGISGGTIASIVAVMSRAIKDPRIRRILLDPYALDPRPRMGGADGRDALGIGFDRRVGRWTAPFFMSVINTRVVRRSNALGGYPFGREFRYTERMSLETGFKGFAMAAAATAGHLGFVAVTAISPLRSVLLRWLPRPGEGPGEAYRKSGYFVLRLVAESNEESPVRLFGRIADNRDPGYDCTAIMLGESAMCLAQDNLETPGGVLTPASAMGMRLIDRLRTAGMDWRVGSSLM